MLNSLKKWVQDVAVDFSPPVPPASSTHHYFYSSPPDHEQEQGRKSSGSAIYLSRPISLDSMESSKMNVLPRIPSPLASPGELDLSHLNREEQEHIANVLRRARAAEEQQQLSTFPSLALPSRLSPSASIPSSLSPSSSSSSSSTNSFPCEQARKYDNEM